MTLEEFLNKYSVEDIEGAEILIFDDKNSLKKFLEVEDAILALCSIQSCNNHQRYLRKELLESTVVEFFVYENGLVVLVDEFE